MLFLAKNCKVHQYWKGYFSFQGKGILLLAVKNPPGNKYISCYCREQVSGHPAFTLCFATVSE